ASAMASRPERHTLLMVSAGTFIGMPALTAALRAGICPAPAWSTCPMITYWTWSPPIPARSRAALIAKPPRSAPEKDFSEPSSRPMGVRAHATITEDAPFVADDAEVAEDMSCDPLPAAQPRSERGFTSNVLTCGGRRHRPFGVIARTLRNHRGSAGLIPC